MKSLIEKGFQVGFKMPFEQRNKLEDFNKFISKRFVLLGEKKAGEDNIILAAMGVGGEVFKETNNSNHTLNCICLSQADCRGVRKS